MSGSRFGWVGAVWIAAGVAAPGCAVQGGPEGGAASLPNAGILPFVVADGEPPIAAKGRSYTRPWALPLPDGGYRAWIAENETGGPERIVAVDSPDAQTWSLEGMRVVLAPAGGWEDGSVRAPCVRHDAGSWALWYVGGHGAGIGVAVSADGEAWVRGPANPIFTPQGWEAAAEPALGAPSVVSDGETYRMYYLGAGGAGVGAAVSGDGLHWERLGTEPIFSVTGDPGDGTVPWDRDALTGLSVIRETTSAGRALTRLWYGAARRKQSGDLEGAIGYAGSFDGLTFTRMEANPVVFATGFGMSDPQVVPGTDPPVMLLSRWWKKEGTNRRVVTFATATLEPVMLDADVSP